MKGEEEADEMRMEMERALRDAVNLECDRHDAATLQAFDRPGAPGGPFEKGWAIRFTEIELGLITRAVAFASGETTKAVYSACDMETLRRVLGRTKRKLGAIRSIEEQEAKVWDARLSREYERRGGEL